MESSENKDNNRIMRSLVEGNCKIPDGRSLEERVSDK